jgi:hypothetical protein
MIQGRANLVTECGVPGFGRGVLFPLAWQAVRYQNPNLPGCTPAQPPGMPREPPHRQRGIGV